jgi:glycosyltransferase involved in cell wall biosynthesis
MRFSIIIATIHRTEEILRLLKSIADQQYNDLEILIVDQNNDERLNPILSQYRSRFHSCICDHQKAYRGPEMKL